MAPGGVRSSTRALGHALQCQGFTNAKSEVSRDGHTDIYVGIPPLGALGEGGMLFLVIRLMHAHDLGLQRALGLMPRSVAHSCLCRVALKGCQLDIFKTPWDKMQRRRSQARTRAGHDFPSLPSSEPEELPLIPSPCPATVAGGYVGSTVQQQIDCQWIQEVPDPAEHGSKHGTVISYCSISHKQPRHQPDAFPSSS